MPHVIGALCCFVSSRRCFFICIRGFCDLNMGCVITMQGVTRNPAQCIGGHDEWAKLLRYMKWNSNGVGVARDADKTSTYFLPCENPFGYSTVRSRLSQNQEGAREETFKLGLSSTHGRHAVATNFCALTILVQCGSLTPREASRSSQKWNNDAPPIGVIRKG